MPPQMTFLVCVSLAVFFIILILQAWREIGWPSFVVQTMCLAVYIVLLNFVFGFPFPQTLASKGPTEEWAAVTALYLCMIMGIVSHFFYNIFQKRRPRWTWRGLIGPVFASPIVFIPLLASFEQAGVEIQFAHPARLMIFLVAFQNGFFWKEFLDKHNTPRRKNKGEQLKP